MPDWIQRIDERVLQWFQDHHSRFLDYNVQAITALGSTTLLAVLALFALGWLLLERRYLTVVLAALVFGGVYFATDGVKSLVARPRPVLGHAATPASPSYSFPSSHASLSMTVFGVLAMCLVHRARRYRVYALLWAVALTLVVGTSRLYLGYHYLSDVIGGWLLGFFCAALFYFASSLMVEKNNPIHAVAGSGERISK
jgi:undecaprenyl-diphosphatase